MTFLRIETVRSRVDCETAGSVFDRVWGISGMVPNEIIIATVHAGGYASLAWWGSTVVGASWGFLGSHDGEQTLHSHVTGVIPEHGSKGIGEALKRHQWSWANERALAAITWSFDPLVRRNAVFNLVKLGAEVKEYHEDFYGSIADGLNRGEYTDRLIVRWAVARHAAGVPRGTFVPSTDWVVPTPHNIESLRVTDPASAREWRARQRADLRKVFTEGWRIMGVTREGAYAVVLP